MEDFREALWADQLSYDRSTNVLSACCSVYKTLLYQSMQCDKLSSCKLYEGKVATILDHPR